MHWEAFLSDSDKDEILSWVKEAKKVLKQSQKSDTEE